MLEFFNAIPSNFIGSLLSTVLLASFAPILNYLKNNFQFAFFHQEKILPLFVITWFLTIVGNIAYFYFFADVKKQSEIYSLLFGVLAPTLLLIAILYQMVRRFYRVGIVAADLSIKDGINYKKALSRTDERFDLLALGARKLTAEKEEFENALKRLHKKGNSARLLLSEPNAAMLVQAATVHNEDSKTLYQDKVKSSKKIIDDFKKRFGIDVRRYRGESEDDMPVFRLMFINSEYCLVSFYVLGHGDGSDLPQIVVKSRRNQAGFYEAFKSYFDRYWRSADDE